MFCTILLLSLCEWIVLESLQLQSFAVRIHLLLKKESHNEVWCCFTFKPLIRIISRTQGRRGGEEFEM